MPAHNHVTIFSNGIADFRRVFTLANAEPREVLLEVKKQHVADVLASLNVYGPVTIPSPPSFAPASENQGRLTLNPQSVLENLAVQLSGAKAKLVRAAGVIEGTLVGLHTEPEATAIGKSIEPKYVVMLTQAGLTKTPLREIVSLVFEDEGVRAEISKALAQNVERIKPDSTQVRFTLESTEPIAEAVVQYTVPAAAWKISYRLRDIGQGKFVLQGLAIVDNNTDEDWNDVLISVVTGEPITFETDLAEAKVPRRSRVNVVQDQAMGAVEVELVTIAQAPAAKFGYADIKKSKRRGGSVAFGSDSLMGVISDADKDTPAQSSLAPTTEAREVGDYCIYESRRPVSIGANRSAVIPVFESELSEAASVLYYKHHDHPERPFRAIRFRNSTEHSLGRGVCTVFLDGIYGGHCVLPATKPEEERLIPHALETGVRVAHEIGDYRTTLVSFRLSEGVSHTDMLTQREILYLIKSSRVEPFQMVIDYSRFNARSKLQAFLIRNRDQIVVEKVSTITDGVRIEFRLEPRDEVMLKVCESHVRRSRIELAKDLDVAWLRTNVIDTNGPLASDPAIRRCLEIQQAIDDKRLEIKQAQENVKSQEGRQERLRKNIGVGGNDEQSNKWRVELGESEDRINRLEQEQLPALERERTDLQTELHKALKSLSAQWRDEKAES